MTGLTWIVVGATIGTIVGHLATRWALRNHHVQHWLGLNHVKICTEERNGHWWVFAKCVGCKKGGPRAHSLVCHCREKKL